MREILEFNPYTGVEPSDVLVDQVFFGDSEDNYTAQGLANFVNQSLQNIQSFFNRIEIIDADDDDILAIGIPYLQLSDRVGTSVPTSIEGPGIYAKDGDLYAFDSDGVSTKLTTT